MEHAVVAPTDATVERVTWPRATRSSVAPSGRARARRAYSQPMTDRDVRIYEVGPRDGLQNEASPIPTDAKLRSSRCWPMPA